MNNMSEEPSDEGKLEQAEEIYIVSLRSVKRDKQEKD
jgi:hypothetical protein